MARQSYLIALGSNMRHRKWGSPRAVLAAALKALDRHKLKVSMASPIVETPPLGPSRRRYANAVCVVRTKRKPEKVLGRLHKIERQFGRLRRGQDWRARVLDLDVVLWSGGAFAADDLVIPHPLFRERRFVLAPAARIVPHWRDPLTGLSIQHLSARLTKPRPAYR